MNLSTEILDRIKNLDVLSGSRRTLSYLAELGQDPDAGVLNYVSVIEKDASLSRKLVALANSSWAGVSNKVCDVRHAAVLLGTTGMQALGMKHSLAAVQSQWKLGRADAQAYCGAALFKANAATLIAHESNSNCAGQAFTMALLQDIAVGLFVAVAGPGFCELLRDCDLDISSQLDEERALFGLEHAQAGCLIANRLGLPQLYCSAIMSHHDDGLLASQMNYGAVTLAHSVASLLPHDARSWKPADIARLNVILVKHFPRRWSNASAFVHDVPSQIREAYHDPYCGFQRLKETIEQATVETAKSAGTLVPTVVPLGLSDRIQRLCDG